MRHLSTAVRLGFLELAIKRDNNADICKIEGVIAMKRPATNWELVDHVCAELGIPIAAADHPIYSEEPTIILLSRAPKQSNQPDTNSRRTSSPKASRSTTNSED